jgi:hypothetical protein
MLEKNRQEGHVDFRLPIITDPLMEPIIIVDTDKITPYFDTFRNTRNLLSSSYGIEFATKVATQVHDVYHAKAGSPFIVEHIPSDIPVVSAFKCLPQTIVANEIRGQKGQVYLHIGTPDSQDLQYDFLQVPEISDLREQSVEISKSLGPKGRDNLQRTLKALILDGSHPDSMDFLKYVQEIKRVYPKTLLNFKVSAQSITKDFNKLLYTAKKGVEIDQMSGLMQAFPDDDFGINLYIGNPLDEELLGEILKFVKHLKTNKSGLNTCRKTVSTLSIGGIGGYGEEIPHKQMLNLFAQIWNQFPEMKIEVEHGRGAVERMSYAIFPGSDITTIAQYLPDYEQQPDSLKTEKVQINNQTCTMVHNVGYLDAQRPEIKVEII